MHKRLGIGNSAIPVGEIPQPRHLPCLAIQLHTVYYTVCMCVCGLAIHTMYTVVCVSVVQSHIMGPCAALAVCSGRVPCLPVVPEVAVFYLI